MSRRSSRASAKRRPSSAEQNQRVVGSAGSPRAGVRQLNKRSRRSARLASAGSPAEPAAQRTPVRGGASTSASTTPGQLLDGLLVLSQAPTQKHRVTTLTLNGRGGIRTCPMGSERPLLTNDTTTMHHPTRLQRRRATLSQPAKETKCHRHQLPRPRQTSWRLAWTS